LPHRWRSEVTCRHAIGEATAHLAGFGVKRMSQDHTSGAAREQWRLPDGIGPLRSRNEIVENVSLGAPVVARWLCSSRSARSFPVSLSINKSRFLVVVEGGYHYICNSLLETEHEAVI
jgi:hypothetical protein